MMLVVTARSARDPSDDNVATFSVILDPTRSLHALDVRCAHGAPALGQLMTRLALAVCLYLQSKHPYLEPVPAPADEPHLTSCNATKRRKAEQRAARRSRLGFTWVRAADATLLVDAAGDERVVGNGQRADPLHHRSWQLLEPVWVEPHYRNQPYGPGRAFSQTDLHRRPPARPGRFCRRRACAIDSHSSGAPRTMKDEDDGVVVCDPPISVDILMFTGARG
jgi:hypothetical protein